MRKCLLPLAAVLFAATFSSSSAEIKSTIAVAPVDWRTGYQSWINGEKLTAQFITELNKTGRYRVVEREHLGTILEEQDLGAAGRMRKGSAPEVGDIEGTQLFIKGIITAAGMTKSEGGSVGFKGVGVGGSQTTYSMTMDVRVFDAQTSIIMNSVSVSASYSTKSRNAAVNVGGVSAGGGQTHTSGPGGAVTRSLIRKAIAVIDAESEKKGWKSDVVTIRGDKAVIRGGTRDGLEDGMVFNLLSLGEQIVDDDGTVLDAGEETTVGKLKIVQVKEKVAFAVKLEGQDPEKGNLVSLIFPEDRNVATAPSEEPAAGDGETAPGEAEPSAESPPAEQTAQADTAPAASETAPEPAAPAEKQSKFSKAKGKMKGLFKK